MTPTTIPTPPQAPALCWGPMDADRHRLLAQHGIHLHVYDAAGVDITRRCAYFNDEPGRELAALYLHDDAGRPVLDLHLRPAREVITTFFVREGLPWGGA